MNTSHCLFLAGAKATKWLAQADNLACKQIGLQAKLSAWAAKSTPTPKESHFGTPKMSLSRKCFVYRYRLTFFEFQVLEHVQRILRNSPDH
jgi:hypothetical protein